MKTTSKNIIGQRFNRLTALRRYGVDGKGQAKWVCRCACGNTKIVVGVLLRDGRVQSCGCLVRDSNIARSLTHGHTRNGRATSEFSTWKSMLERCYKLYAPQYKNYGRRGIRVCKRWEKFENFILDMGKKPTAKHSLDRIDNNKHYTASNCRWATYAEQNRNKRTNHIIEFRNEKLCLIDAALKYGLTFRALWGRLIQQRWPLEKALLTPLQKRRSA